VDKNIPKLLPLMLKLLRPKQAAISGTRVAEHD